VNWASAFADASAGKPEDMSSPTKLRLAERSRTAFTKLLDDHVVRYRPVPDNIRNVDPLPAEKAGQDLTYHLDIPFSELIAALLVHREGARYVPLKILAWLARTLRAGTFAMN